LNLHLFVLAIYSLSMMALGLWIGRRVRGASDFFVAGRQLGPGLIFSTMLAANIGAGSTVGATAQGYSTGASAWWWVGSAAIGSAVLAFWVGPAMRRASAAANLQTVGDYLESRYSQTVRGLLALLLWIGSLLILSSQLIGIGWILNTVTGLPKALGAALGGIVITVYFTAGGLLTSARVNVVQLAVKLAGFALAVPLTLAAAGGWTALFDVQVTDVAYWDFWRSDVSAGFLIAFAPAFVVSPGLLQKIFGARDDRTVRVGVGLNALGLLLYSVVPVILGVAAREMFPALADSQQALPVILMNALPPIIGAIGLAAVFSAEISAADAVLLMLTTSFSRDLYKRFVAPEASERRVLRVAQTATLVSGLVGIGVAASDVSITTVVTIFYSLLTVTFFVPIVGGLFVPGLTSRDVLASISAGMLVMLAIHLMTGGRGWGVLSPALGGLCAAALAAGVSHATSGARLLKNAA
jgi:SSS family solute:Na+ symporter